jgi:SAM-dependent methyltransferase
MEQLPIGALSWRRGLQFSPDPAIKPSWFCSYEITVFGSDNTIDIQKIARDDGAYDFISLNHVIEFVPDARASFSELIRVLSPGGIVQIGFSTLSSRDISTDWELPQGVHGYYHLFGTDFTDYFELEKKGVAALAIAQQDPVTGQEEWFHFFSKSTDALSRLEDFVRIARGESVTVAPV